MNVSGSYSLQNRVYFFGLFALLIIAVLWLMGDYLGVIAFSLVMVVILKPVHRFFLRHLGDRDSLATFLTLLLFFVALIVPAWKTQPSRQSTRNRFASGSPTHLGGLATSL